MTKYKEGDEVRVVDRIYGHNLTIGEVYTIEHVDKTDHPLQYKLRNKNGFSYWVSNEELEHPNPKVEIRKFFEILTLDGEVFKFQESVEGQLDSIISRFYNKDISTLVIPDDKDFNTGGCIIVKDKITAIKWD